MMSSTFDVYCDESGHLAEDGQPAMVLGAVWCNHEETAGVNRRLRDLKRRHGLSPGAESKWSKISPGGQAYYSALIDEFFALDCLRFRGLVVPDKGALDHKAFGQDHDTWYYKMYFSMLKVVINPKDRFRIYLDIKDTRSAKKVAKLHDVLCNNFYDFDRAVVERVQTVRSHECEILQMADVLMGAVGSANRGTTTSSAKLALMASVRKQSGYGLTQSTLVTEPKFNLFVWRSQEVGV